MIEISCKLFSSFVVWQHLKNRTTLLFFVSTKAPKKGCASLSDRALQLKIVGVCLHTCMCISKNV